MDKEKASLTNMEVAIILDMMARQREIIRSSFENYK